MAPGRRSFWVFRIVFTALSRSALWKRTNDGSGVLSYASYARAA